MNSITAKFVLIVLVAHASILHASEGAYRVVSRITNGDSFETKRTIIRTFAGLRYGGAGEIKREALASHIWFPNQCGAGERFATVTGGGYPPVNVVVESRRAGKIAAGKDALFKCEFTLAGGFKGEDLGDGASEGRAAGAIRSIEIEGGGFVISSEDGEAHFAGRIWLSQRALPALWRDDATEGELKSGVETAWTRIP